MKKILIYLLSLTLLSCSKLIEVDPPVDRLVTKKIFDSDATSSAAMAGLYAGMLNDLSFPLPYNIAFFAGLYADELTYKQTNISMAVIYKNNLDAKSSQTNSIWTKGYYFIYQSNNIIEGLKASSNVSEAVKQQLSGECYFMRAFWLFYLVNLYGDVSLVITTDYSLNGVMPRAPSADVYKQIVSDLQQAATLLTEKYVGADGKSAVNDRVRPNKHTATALLARVQLYQQNWPMAAQEATKLISNTAAYILEPLENVFKATSREAIWQFQAPTGSNGAMVMENTPEGKNFIMAPAPGNGSTLSDALLNTFVSTDQRLLKWVGKVSTTTPPIELYTFPFKYKEKAVISTVVERSAVLRLAEQYLIRAEALTQQDKLAEAVADLDKIRGRAGIPLLADVNPNIPKTQLLDSIYAERQREFFCEWGHRWLDLKRTGRANAVMVQVATKKEITWSPDKLLWPIPLNDIINSGNKIKQNKGYE